MRRVLITLCLSLALSGCLKALPMKFDLHLPVRKPVSGKVTVQKGELTLMAPDGFCVDPTSTRDGPEGSFVLWGSCAAIGGNASAPKPAQQAMLSATIGPVTADPVETAFESYEAFFKGRAGRAALARSGKARDVEILAVKREERRLLLKISDHSAPTVAPVDPVYWREITGLGGHVSALSVLPLAGSRLDDQTQIDLLSAFDETIRDQN
ncbi:hypothetical protein ACTTAI_20010 [Rhodobacter capsulatus]|uniref:hypothetical protein n=1 Tax=Rhodobacter capsulatus TaxID=1061 RepID=UPI004026C8E4